VSAGGSSDWTDSWPRALASWSLARRVAPVPAQDRLRTLSRGVTGGTHRPRSTTLPTRGTAACPPRRDVRWLARGHRQLSLAAEPRGHGLPRTGARVPASIPNHLPLLLEHLPRILLISTLRSIHQGHLSRIFFPSHSPALRFVLACDGQCAGAFVMAGSLLGGV